MCIRDSSYSNHNYTDKVLQQRFKLTITDVPDGDIFGIGKKKTLPKWLSSMP